jgi:hypothetical protein
MGLLDAKVVILDSVHVDLCTAAKCKHLKHCPWLINGSFNFPKDCFAKQYEGARPLHKTQKERYYGYKIHRVIDVRSGLTTVCIMSPKADCTIGLRLLKRLHKNAIHPDIIICDRGFDDEKLRRYAWETMGSHFVCPLRHDWEAIRFPITLLSGERVYIAPCGTPLCPAGHPMKYLGTVDNNRATAWLCPAERMKSEHMENGRCLYEGSTLCKIVLKPSMDYRRISVPPIASELWDKIYSVRKYGEQPFSQDRINLSLDVINYKRKDSVQFHLLMTVITALIVAIIAAKLNIPYWMRASELRAIRFIIQNALVPLSHMMVRELKPLLAIGVVILFVSWYDHPPDRF